jgi:hypothetical protein
VLALRLTTQLELYSAKLALEDKDAYETRLPKRSRDSAYECKAIRRLESPDAGD